MAQAVPHDELSAQIVRDLLRDELRAAVADGTIDDPRAASRDDEMVLTSFPDESIVYPLVIVDEANDASDAIHMQRVAHQHDYDVQISIAGDNKTHVKILRDQVRGWVLSNAVDLAGQGFMDLSIASSTPAAFEDRDRALQWQFTIASNVITGENPA
ncbi:hypothetical protein BRD56_05435 [Thermoplasmatales archaeon SW_10_69_26]|nr:MAG: hypothetical protein BRD56_05435 [Thermoplasmatales archaeon SW_10_69_26]